MKIKDVAFKITTTNKLTCHKCKSVIDGKEGYIRIFVERERGYNFFGGKDGVFRICWGCFEKSLKEIDGKRKTRKEDYDNLLKRRILIGLK